MSQSKIEEYTKEELQNLLDTSSSYKEVLDKIGLSTRGNNYNTLNKYIKLYSLSTEKIDISRKQTFNQTNAYNTKDKFLFSLENESCTLKNRKILEYLIKYRIKEYSCEKCGITKWNDLPITLEIHHKDGNHDNTKLENLEILCPNCHSQTDNFRFKNKKHAEAKLPKDSLCPICNKNHKAPSSQMCQECRNKKRIKSIPTKEELEKLIFNNSFVGIGRIFNVTDNAVKKWCEKYGLPSKASDIKNIKLSMTK